MCTGMNFNTCVGSGSADLRVWMQPLRGWVSFSIPELRGNYFSPLKVQIVCVWV